MARIDTYDSAVKSRNDKILGTDVDNSNATANFPLGGIYDYFNESGSLESSTLRFYYQDVVGAETREEGTISFDTSQGVTVNFSAITSFMLSKHEKNDLDSPTDISGFYTGALIGCKVLISQANDISNNGIFTIDTAVVDETEPNFYNIGVTYEGGSGYLQDNVDYLVTVIQWSGISGMEVGTEVTGATSYQLFFADASNQLAQSAAMVYQNGFKLTQQAIGDVALTVQGILGQTADYIQITSDGGGDGDVLRVLADGNFRNMRIDADNNTISNIGLVEFDTDTADSFKFLVGMVLDSPSVGVNSNGVDVSLTYEKNGGGDVRMVYSTGVYTLDATPILSVSLTAGSDTSPQLNYVYIPISTKVLTVSTTYWPSEEHVKVATVVVPSAATVLSDGVYKLHGWTDHVYNEEGHLAHLNYWIRQQAATWESGALLTPNITVNAGSEDNIDISISAGEILQLHEQDWPAFNTATGGHMHVVNKSGAEYTSITDLNAADEDDAGNAITNNKWTNIVIWGVINAGAADSKVMVNLPSGFHSSEAAALADVEGYSNYTIPTIYRGTGFLIARLTLKYTTAASGTWELVENKDLRGLSPGVAGGSTSGGVEFPDNTFVIFDEADETKRVAFEVSGVATGTTRTMTIPDVNTTLVGANENTDNRVPFWVSGELTTSPGMEYSNGLLLESQDATHVPLTLKGAVGQSANMLDIQTSAGVTKFRWTASTGYSVDAGYSINNFGTNIYLGVYGGEIGLEADGTLSNRGRIGWTSNGTNAHTANAFIKGVSTGNYIGISTDDASALLHIAGHTATDVQFKVVAANSQSANLIEVNSFAGSGGDLFRLSSDGNTMEFGQHNNYFVSSGSGLEVYGLGTKAATFVSNWVYTHVPILAFSGSGFHFNDSAKRGKISAESTAASDLLLHLEAHASQTGDLMRVSSNGGSTGDKFKILAGGTVDIGASQAYRINGANIISDAAGVATLENIDDIDVTTQTTLEDILEFSDQYPVQNNQSGTTYTLVLTDDGKIIEMNNASANTLTVPPNSTVAFPINTQIIIWQYGAGQTTVSPGAGVTIRSAGGATKIAAQYGMATLVKRGTDEWVLAGNITT